MKNVIIQDIRLSRDWESVLLLVNMFLFQSTRRTVIA